MAPPGGGRREVTGSVFHVYIYCRMPFRAGGNHLSHVECAQGPRKNTILFHNFFSARALSNYTHITCALRPRNALSHIRHMSHILSLSTNPLPRSLSSPEEVETRPPEEVETRPPASGPAYHTRFSPYHMRLSPTIPAHGPKHIRRHTISKY